MCPTGECWTSPQAAKTCIRAAQTAYTAVKSAPAVVANGLELGAAVGALSGFTFRKVSREVVDQLGESSIQANAEKGRLGEEIATNDLESEFGGDRYTILEQVTGTYEDGSTTIFDNVVIDSDGNVILTNETKTGDAGYSDQQQRYRNGEPVQLTGDNAGAAAGRVINNNNTQDRLTRVSDERIKEYEKKL